MKAPFQLKNISLFLQVAELYVKRKAPDLPKLRFVIVGDGHLRDRLEREAAERGHGRVLRGHGELSLVQASAL